MNPENRCEINFEYKNDGHVSKFQLWFWFPTPWIPGFLAHLDFCISQKILLIKEVIYKILNT